MTDLAELRQLVAAGYSDQQIADRCGVTARTVLRWRKRHQLVSQWTPDLAPCGTEAAYARGHRDPECQRAHALYVADYIARVNASTPSTSRARQPWTPAEDRVLLSRDGTLQSRARQLGRTYAAAKRRLDHLRATTPP